MKLLQLKSCHIKNVKWVCQGESNFDITNNAISDESNLLDDLQALIGQIPFEVGQFPVR